MDNSEIMSPQRKRRRTLRILVAALLLLTLFFPLPVRKSDQERIIAASARRLLDQNRVFLDWKFIPFYDAKLIASSNPQWHYLNETELDCSALETMGFRSLSRSDLAGIDNWQKWYDGNVYVEITTRYWRDENAPDRLRFNVYHGTLGAQGYRVRIYRCVLGLFAAYQCEWVS